MFNEVQVVGEVYVGSSYLYIHHGHAIWPGQFLGESTQLAVLQAVFTLRSRNRCVGGGGLRPSIERGCMFPSAIGVLCY